MPASYNSAKKSGMSFRFHLEKSCLVVGVGLLYLQLGKGETTAGTNTAVVPLSRASHNGTQLVDGARGNSGGLCETSLTTAVLLAGLYSRKSCQPIEY